MKCCTGFFISYRRRKTQKAAGGITGHMKRNKRQQPQEAKPASRVILAQLAEIRAILDKPEREDNEA